MFVVAALLIGLFANPVAAAAGFSCHCFRDRSFDPAKPEAADPYILATTQNSLLSAVFGVDKKAIVNTKMRGAPNEDLWMAHFVGSRVGLRADELLRARGRFDTWRAALADLKVTPARVGGALGRALQGVSSDEALASTAVDEVLTTRLGATREEVEELRGAGAADAEAIASVFLARRTGRSPEGVYREVATTDATWGVLLHGAGIEPVRIEDDIRVLVK